MSNDDLDVKPKKPLMIIPVYLRDEQDVTALKNCLGSIHESANTNVQFDLLLINDGSPEPTAQATLSELVEQYDAEIIHNEKNHGFSAVANMGLGMAAANEQQAFIMHQDVILTEMHRTGCDPLMELLLDPADIVVGKVLWPNGLIQSTAFYFSLLHRHWDHMSRWLPPNQAQANQRVEGFPVTHSLIRINPNVIGMVGGFDEKFDLSLEDIDFCVRALMLGMRVAYNPKVISVHSETLMRGVHVNRFHKEELINSQKHFFQKHQQLDYKRWIPPIDRPRSDKNVYRTEGTKPSEEFESGDSPAVASSEDASTATTHEGATA